MEVLMFFLALRYKVNLFYFCDFATIHNIEKNLHLLVSLLSNSKCVIYCSNLNTMNNILY